MDITDLKERYLYLLRESLVDAIYKEGQLTHKGEPLTEKRVGCGNYWPLRAHTMVGRQRLDNIKYCIEYCLEHNIPGDFLEAGVWRGGACIYAAAVLKVNGSNRKVYVADSFSGVPPPDKINYPQDKKDNHYLKTYLSVSQKKVEDNFRIYDLLYENVIFVKGLFKDSLPKLDVKSLAVLRVDGDMYSSTMQVLDALYDKVPIGGFVILDDFSKRTHASLRAKEGAIDFRAKRNVPGRMYRIDYQSVYWQKEA